MLFPTGDDRARFGRALTILVLPRSNFMSQTLDLAPGVVSVRGWLNDLTVGLGQQMFFWGRDVVQGVNLLVSHGFERQPSTGLQGTSCYRLPWRGGLLELHGACAGWYPSDPEQPGFLFVRSDKRCYAHHLSKPVVPGRYDHDDLRAGKAKPVLTAARVFVSWLADYEAWIDSEKGPEYRRECHGMFARLPTSRTWLPPDLARQWWDRFAAGDPALPRARAVMKRR